MRKSQLAAIAIGLVCYAAGEVGAVQYKVTLLYRPPGYDVTEAFAISGGVEAGYGFGVGTSNLRRALVWNGTAPSYVDLTPPSSSEAQAYNISGNSVVGWAFLSDGFNVNQHAVMWNGFSGSYVDLNRGGLDGSLAWGVSGNTQVGQGWGPFTGGQSHALLWTGNARSTVDLNPSFALTSIALDASDKYQVGFYGDYPRPVKWSGSAASAVDLTPPGLGAGVADAVSGETQAGWAASNPITGLPHAFLWHGTAASAIDLNPAGYYESGVSDVFGNVEVGSGRTEVSYYHALLWAGSAGSVVDLHSYLANLPVQLLGSYATGIDSDGTIVGFGQDSNSVYYPLIWTPVPEPSSWMMLCCGTIGATLFARRTRRCS